MVVCPFYIQGRCKFGDRCYNEHPTTPVANKNAFLRLDKKVFENMVSDVLVAEKGNQWPLSCYAPFKEHPNVPNMKDTSSDELRQIYYQAKNENRLNDYVTHVAGLIKEAGDIRTFLKTPSVELGELLENILSNKISDQILPESDFSSFRIATDTENTTGNIFGGSSISQSNTISHSANIFSQPVSSSTTNIFSSKSDQQSSTSSQSIFGGSNLFNNSPQINQNIFAQNNLGNAFETSQTNQNYFQPNSAPQSNSTTLFGATTVSDSIFGSNNSQNIASNVFENSQINQNSNASIAQNTFSSEPSQNNIFGTNAFGAQSQMGLKSVENYYSELDSLTNEEREMYLAPKFSFQKIPLHPPPESLCK